MADDRIEVEIVLDDGSVQKGFAKIRSEAKKTETSVAGVFKRGLTTDISKPFDVARNSIFNLRTAVTGLVAALGAGAFLRTITDAASQQQDAVNALNVSLKVAGTFSEEASQSFQKLASSLQAQSRFGDEVILQQVALARNYTRTNQEAEKLIVASLDLAEATGITLDTAVQQLGKTFSGSTGLLAQSIPALKNLTAEQLRAGEALDIVAQRFGGAAAGAVKTYSGSLAQLKNTFGDFLEQLGESITSSPVVINLFNALSKTLTTLINSFGKGGVNINQTLSNLVINSAAAASAVIESFSALAQVPTFIEFSFTQVQIALLKGVNAVLAPLSAIGNAFSKILGTSVEFGDTVVSNFQKISQLEGSLETIAKRGNNIDSSFNTARKAVEDFTTTFQELQTQAVAGPSADVESGGGGIIPPIVDASLEALREKVRLLQAETKTAISDAFFNTDDVLADTPTVFESLENKGTEALQKLQASLTATRDLTTRLSMQIGQAVNNGIANTITNAVGAAVKALRAGENGFSAFAKAALATIGDLAVQLGQTLIASGIGIEALKVLGGGAAIAAGIALVAIGTLLKSSVGGADTSAAGGSAVTPPLSDLQPGGISDGLTEPQTGVQINIEGNIFDSDATGLRIANILKDQGFQNAVVS